MPSHRHAIHAPEIPSALFGLVAVAFNPVTPVRYQPPCSIATGFATLPKSPINGAARQDAGGIRRCQIIGRRCSPILGCRRSAASIRTKASTTLGDNDTRTILDREYGLLHAGEYDEVVTLMEPLVAAAAAYLEEVEGF